MKYNFDLLANRKGKNAIKWNVGENELPMFIADQDFICLPEIYETIVSDAKVMAYGYTDMIDEYFLAYKNWYKKYHNANFDEKDMVFCEGVVATISSAVRHLLTPGDKVTILTPVYNIFFNSIVNNGCTVLECPLINKNMDFYIDFPLLEKCLSESKMLIFCNPHNPVGKLYTKEEMEEVGKLANKYGVIVISDEIHADFVQDDGKYIPFSNVNELNKDISITCLSPSKTFNVAGLKSSILICSNEALKKKIVRAINTDEVAEPNYFAVYPVMAAYNNGYDYVKQMNEYIYNNKKVVVDFIKKNLPKLDVKVTNSLYLIWIDATAYNRDDLASYIRGETGLILVDGKIYGKAGSGFLRMNVATSLENVKDGLERLQKALLKL